MSPLTFCSLFKGRIQGLYWVLSPTHPSESLWFLAGTSLRGSYTWAWHQRRWSSSLNATWIMRRNLVQQKVSLLSKEQHLSMWRPRVPLLIPKYSTSKSGETQLSMQCQNWEVWSSAMSVHGQYSSMTKPNWKEQAIKGKDLINVYSVRMLQIILVCWWLWRHVFKYRWFYNQYKHQPYLSYFPGEIMRLWPLFFKYSDVL